MSRKLTNIYRYSLLQLAVARLNGSVGRSLSWVSLETSLEIGQADDSTTQWVAELFNIKYLRPAPTYF